MGNDKFWKNFCHVLGLEEIKDTPEFSTNPERVKNRDKLFTIIQNIISEKKAEEWLELFDKNDIPCGPILSPGKILNHPQIKERNMVVEVNHPGVGKIKLTGIPVKLSHTPGNITSPPPLLGEHTEEVLMKLLNYGGNEIENFIKEQVI